MLYRSPQSNQTNDESQNHSSDNQNIHQYGTHNQHQQQAVNEQAVEQHQRSILLDLPPETLTSITSHLTPPALLALGSVSSYLAHHVKEDNTWRRAYACHFLGISPESDIRLANYDLQSQSKYISSAPASGSWKSLLLRRAEGRSWREEFSWRYVMIGRWRDSRSTPTTYNPILHSPITRVHLTSIPSSNFSQTSPNLVHEQALSQSQPIPPLTRYTHPSTRSGTPALLTSSAQYGVVARSIPLSGRVLNGYLDARFAQGGNLNLGVGGIMNGNPNAQFTPNVTASDVITFSSSSHASTTTSAPSMPSALVMWGTRAGDIIFSFAPRALDSTLRVSGGAGVQVRRCRVGDEHEGMVRDVKFACISGDQEHRRWAVSAGEDGRVKLWDAGIHTSVDANLHIGQDGAIRCLWSSNPMLLDRFGSRVIGVMPGGGILPDKCIRTEAYFSLLKGQWGVVVGAGESGDLHVWIGPASAFGIGKNFSLQATVREVFVECPFKTVDSAPKTVKALHIEPRIILDGDKAEALFLVAYEDDPLFYKVSVVFDETGQSQHGKSTNITPFGDANFGPTSVVVPYFGSKDASFVLVGDHIGCVSLYNWEDSSPLSTTSPPILPLRTFEAHRDGASVTALWWDGLVLVTGSARGTTHVWDGVSFAHLRSFVSPVGRIRGRGRGQARLAGGALALAPHAAGGALVPAAAGGREAVRHIVVNPESDVLVVAVGDTIMAWHADVVGRGTHRGGKGGVRGRHAPGTGVHAKKRTGAGIGKYIGQYEMRQTIAESRDMLDAERKASSTSSVALARREVEHLAGLDSLGLSEAEAVEYVLMLSRDEAVVDAADRARRMEEEWQGSLAEEQGVFEADSWLDGEDEDNHEDDDGSSLYGPSPSVSSGASSRGSSVPSGSSSPSISSSSSSSVHARNQHTRLGMTIAYRGLPRTPSGQPILSPPRTNEKVQISSPWRGGEPMQAGEEYLVPDDYVQNDASLINVIGDEVVQEQHFPPIPGSAGTSPGDDKGLIKAKERNSSDPGLSPRGKGKGKGRSNSQKVPACSSFVSTNPTPIAGGSASPKSSQSNVNAWGSPLKVKSSTSAAAGSSSSSFSAVAASAVHHSPTSPDSTSRARISPPVAGIYKPQGYDMDEDLRYALELSLAEARSRGEDI